MIRLADKPLHVHGKGEGVGKKLSKWSDLGVAFHLVGQKLLASLGMYLCAQTNPNLYGNAYIIHTMASRILSATLPYAL